MNMQTCTKSNPRETEGTKTLLFINIQSYNERSDGSYVYRKTKQISLPFFRSCFLDTLKKSRDHLPLVTSGYYQDGRSLISSFSRSSKMAAMSNSRPWATFKCQNPYPGGGTVSQFPVGERVKSPPFFFSHPKQLNPFPGLLGNGALTCTGLHFCRHFLVTDTKFFQIWNVHWGDRPGFVRMIQLL